jgi:predicted O-methyltransferase YrrM
MNTHLNNFEIAFQKKYFSDLEFLDEREFDVFLSYIKGFGLLMLDSKIHKILEIGGGQSTALLSKMSGRLGWELYTIDMNPDAIALKIRNQSINEITQKNIHFRKGVSLSAAEINNYYTSDILSIGGIAFGEAIKNSKSFIDTSIDGRKAPNVAKALGLLKFDPDAVLYEIARFHGFKKELLNVFKTPGNEFEYFENSRDLPEVWLANIMDSENIDVIFLDSGEFSSLPEWEIVERKLRPGGYVILHDIFFPKSFKNWLICGSIKANQNYEIIYVDTSLPQGLMVAQKLYE